MSNMCALWCRVVTPVHTKLKIEMIVAKTCNALQYSCSRAYWTWLPLLSPLSRLADPQKPSAWCSMKAPAHAIGAAFLLQSLPRTREEGWETVDGEGVRNEGDLGIFGEETERQQGDSAWDGVSVGVGRGGCRWLKCRMG